MKPKFGDVYGHPQGWTVMIASSRALADTSIEALVLFHPKNLAYSINAVGRIWLFDGWKLIETT